MWPIMLIVFYLIVMEIEWTQMQLSKFQILQVFRIESRVVDWNYG